MKPVDQTIFGDPEGNCFNAVLASIFEVEIEKITPQILTDPLWAVKFCKFILKEFGLFMIELPAYLPLMPVGYHEMSGPTPRGHTHSVVGKDGKMVHDPHPDRTGLLKVDGYSIFVPMGCSLTEMIKVKNE